MFSKPPVGFASLLGIPLPQGAGQPAAPAGDPMAQRRMMMAQMLQRRNEATPVPQSGGEAAVNGLRRGLSGFLMRSQRNPGAPDPEAIRYGNQNSQGGLY